MMTICIPCGYIYQGEAAFESLSEDWCCPECGAGIASFTQIDETLVGQVEF